MWIARTVSRLSEVVGVGGMFLAYLDLRPAAAKLEPPQRLALWSHTFRRCFPWVWGAVVLLPATGYWMIFAEFGGFTNLGLYLHIMHAVGIAMIVIFLHLFFSPYKRLNRAVAAGDFPAAGKQLAQIRMLIGTNLTLGLLPVIVAASGAYWT